jgi:hypothetical protein
MDTGLPTLVKILFWLDRRMMFDYQDPRWFLLSWLKSSKWCNNHVIDNLSSRFYVVNSFPTVLISRQTHMIPDRKCSLAYLLLPHNDGTNWDSLLGKYFLEKSENGLIWYFFRYIWIFYQIYHLSSLVVSKTYKSNFCCFSADVFWKNSKPRVLISSKRKKENGH